MVDAYARRFTVSAVMYTNNLSTLPTGVYKIVFTTLHNENHSNITQLTTYEYANIHSKKTSTLSMLNTPGISKGKNLKCLFYYLSSIFLHNLELAHLSYTM